MTQPNLVISVKHPRITLARVGVLLLIAIALCILALCVGLPSYEVASDSKVIARVLRDARSVTITEFIPYLGTAGDDLVWREHVVRSVAATPEQISQFRDATGWFPAVELPFAHHRCFNPHHRVEAIRANGTTFRLDVCFLCSNLRFDGAGIHSIPSPWLSRLTRFFTAAGMPPRTKEEYAKIKPGSF